MKSHGHLPRVRPGTRLGLALVLVVGIGGAHGRQHALDARSSDPLTMPRPKLDEPLILPIDGRAPAAKIVATMPAALRELEDPSSVSVVVSLHEPIESSRRAAPRGRLDAVRRARIATVEQDFAAAAARLGFRATRGLTHFAIVAGEISPDRLEYLAALPQVRAIEPDRSFRAARVEGAALIRADDVQAEGGLGAGITVVVLDSGINANHPELAGKVVEQRSHNGPVGQDGFNHGTQVAGIIAGDGGLAPEAKLWDVRVIGSDGLTTVAILIDALDGLMPHMDEFEILVGAFADPNFRFSSSCDQLNPAAAQVVQDFRDAGNLLIAAAGDAADSAGLGIPACLDAILAAGAVYDANVGSTTFGGCTDSTTSADKIACYSNSGPLLDFLAPGHCTTTPQASGGLENCFGGTSAATAYAGGVAAQIWSLLPSATVGQIENSLTNQGTPITDPRNGITRRRINAIAALNSLPSGPAPTATSPAPTATPQAPGPSPTPTQTPLGPAPTQTPTPPDGVPPAAPSNLTAQTLTQSAVLLEWSDNSNNEAAFLIEGRTQAGLFQELATVAANTTFAAVEELFSATNYTFRVRARSASLNSSQYSNTASTTTAAGPTACVRDANTACLLGGKFRIRGEMKDFDTPPMEFDNQVMSFTGGRAESDQAVFFESFTPGNFEVGIKMVDACSFPPGNPVRNYWVFAGGLTNAKTDITVQDTVTGGIFTWHNPAGQFPTSIGNTMAFPCANPGGIPSCARDGMTACLIGGRFRVTGTMQNFDNPPITFPTKVIQFAQDRAETDQAVFHQSFNPGNFEVGVKMVDACAFPPGPLRNYWIFYGGLTNAEAEVLAVHSASGRVDLWRNPAGTFPTTVGNTAAFPCP